MITPMYTMSYTKCIYEGKIIEYMFSPGFKGSYFIVTHQAASPCSRLGNYPPPYLSWDRGQLTDKNVYTVNRFLHYERTEDDMLM